MAPKAAILAVMTTGTAMADETTETEEEGQTQAQATFLSLENIPFLILAGGKGSRLGDLSKDIPKAMIEIGGEPFIAHVLRLLRREGVRRVVLLVEHFAKQIEDYVQDGAGFGLAVSYSRDGDSDLGTGGAVKKALEYVDQDLAVMYGDTYLDISMPTVYTAFKSSGLGAMMALLENNNQWAPSNVEFDELQGKVLKYDKKKPTNNMRFIDYGLSFFSRDLLETHCKNLKKTSFDMGDLFKAMAKKKELAGFAVNRRFYDIGTIENMIETRAYLSQNNLWQNLEQ